MKVLLFCVFACLFVVVSSFWDDATTTEYDTPTKEYIRISFFRWQETKSLWKRWFIWGWDWEWSERNRRLNVVCGISYNLINIGTGTILNRRTVITACNLIDEYYNIPRELRIWALGSRGLEHTPWRYRVWRFTRLFPKSLNPEHMHGAKGTYSPRHDVCIIHTLDMMMTINHVSTRGHYPHRSFLINEDAILENDLWHTGSGYVNLKHIHENYKIYIETVEKSSLVDCSKFLPKFWGKFICVRNVKTFSGLQNGAGLHSVHVDRYETQTDYLAGIGCFEIRYNEDRIFAFTDLRYYKTQIEKIAHIEPGEYYEYAYPQWGMAFGFLWNSLYGNAPRIPEWQIRYDLYPLG